MKKDKKGLIICIALIIICIIYTLLVKYIDLKAIGPNKSVVGFSHINKAFFRIINVHMSLYKITEILGYIVLLIPVIYVAIGLYELIKRKSIYKVDKEIYLLGCLYVIIFSIYVFFEKFIVNYRPVLIDNSLEASYPSSHTVLALCVCISSIMINNILFKKRRISKIGNIISIILAFLIVIGRMLSGVHWISDILGGMIISITVLYCFNYILKLIRNN